MTDTRPRLTPGPDHPITLEPSAARVVVRSGGTVIADTGRAIVLREASYPPVFYIPPEDVDQARLQASDHHTYCPYKGEASYYDIVGSEAADLSNVIWYYPEPYQPVAEISGYLAFYPDRVAIEVTPDGTF
jgi:uncharacterized protein (DUF427 family)